MSWAEGVVRFAAATLPKSIRERYLEEWRGDVAAAPSAGVSAASIAAGALVFSATLDRDVPAISGESLPARARRHARWALLLLAVVAFGALPLRSMVPGLTELWLPIVAPILVVALWRLWRAARLSGVAGHAVAALTTGGLAIFVTGMLAPPALWDAIPGHGLLYSLALLMLIVAAVMGTGMWLLDGLPMGLRVVVIVGITVAGGLVFAANSFAMIVSPYVVGLVALAVSLVIVVRSHRRTSAPDPAGASRTRWVVVVSSVVLLAAIAYAAIESLVLLPMRLAPGLTLDEIYATLAPQVLAIGVGDVIWWASLSTLAVCGFLVAGLVLARTPLVGDHRVAVVVTSGMLAIVLMTAEYARAALTNGVAQAVSTSRWELAPTASAVSVIWVLALLASLVGLIAPRPSVAPPAAALA